MYTVKIREAKMEIYQGQRRKAGTIIMMRLFGKICRKFVNLPKEASKNFKFISPFKRQSKI
jgi:hypothetical protein